MDERIGFIGLGVMGKPMARNLLRAGRQVVLYNRSESAVEELQAEGAKVAADPRGVAASSEVVITMLPDSDAVEDVTMAPTGLLAGAQLGSLLIDMSTVDPDVSRRLGHAAREKGIAML